MYEDWPETTKVLSGQLRNLRGGASDVMKAFSGVAQTALAPKALDAKTKELIALGIGIAIRCDDCIAFHIKAAVESGATRRALRSADISFLISTLCGNPISKSQVSFVMKDRYATVSLAPFELQKGGKVLLPKIVSPVPNKSYRVEASFAF